MSGLTWVLILGGMMSGFAATYPAPRVVGIPPADAGRGLVRVSEKEIRHYDGSRKQPGYLVTRDDAETWVYEKTPATYPPNFGGMAKEAPAFAKNPLTGEFIRVQPIKDFVFHSRGGLDGDWLAVTKDGHLTADWRGKKDHLLTIPGIMRTPIFINGGKRVILPSHGNGTTMWISDDGGLQWRASPTVVRSPAHEVGGIHQGLRWQNIAVESSIVELKNGTLWALFRTSQDYHYESFSKDYGETWSVGRPSRFAATLTMPTVGRLADGRLLVLWTNQVAMPELVTATGRGEDAFTNRDTLHAAVSDDEGKTWRGFREVALDEHRGRRDYATWGGPQDRGNHQAEFLPLDQNRVLVSYGQHANHRRLVIMDLRWLLEQGRSGDFSNGADDWLHHTFVPQPRGHCSYDRKPAALVIPDPRKKDKNVLEIRFWDDPELVNESSYADYRAGGASWNFPATKSGKLQLRFRLPKGSAGAHLSLTDRLFNACDRTTPQLACGSWLLAPGQPFGNLRLLDEHDYTLLLEWKGTSSKDLCRVSLDGKFIGASPWKNASFHGLSYIHLIAAGDKPGSSILIENVSSQAN
ncbi:MAG: exo-alpha-sialidase [Akkermansiaceae bacterium]